MKLALDDLELENILTFKPQVLKIEFFKITKIFTKIELTKNIQNPRLTIKLPFSDLEIDKVKVKIEILSEVVSVEVGL